MKNFLSFIALASLLFLMTNESLAKNANKENLENCLDEFFAPQVPIGPIQEYSAWVSDAHNSQEAFKVCQKEVKKFLSSPGYQIDKNYVNEGMWIKAMFVLKHSFKPNQKDGKIRFGWKKRREVIGSWWALKKK